MPLTKCIPVGEQGFLVEGDPSRLAEYVQFDCTCGWRAGDRCLFDRDLHIATKWTGKENATVVHDMDPGHYGFVIVDQEA